MRAARAEPTRGQPVIAIVAVLAVWVSLRLVFWQSPLMLGEAGLDQPLSSVLEALPGRMDSAGHAADEESARRYTSLEREFEPLVSIELARLDDGGLRDWPAREGTGPSDLSAEPTHLRRVIGEPSATGGMGCRQFEVGCLASSQARESRQGNRRDLAAASATTMADPVFALALAVPSRWMMSSWFFWRDDSLGERQAATTPNYGRSQAGAVLAYLLAPESGHRPQAYSRATTALEGQREAELAAGLSARPLPDVPVRLAAEARLSLRDGATQLRPAAFIVTELPPVSLPAQLVGEVYAQAGWVGGDFATGFLDAQMRLTRTLVQSRAYSLSAGGGAWVGAQQDTRRFDIGPSVSTSFRLGDDVYGRLSADYRVRVAGNAAPASGPALTLSAGF